MEDSKEETVNVTSNSIPKTISHKKFVYTIILVVTLTGSLVPFAAQFILPFFISESKIAGAEIWNQYVGIILGVVATLMSIVSLKMSFDNVEQSHQTELRTRELLEKIEMHLTGIEHNQTNYVTKFDFYNMLRNGYDFERDQVVNDQWTTEATTSKKESKNI